jgi:hypothetical protein
MHLFKKDIFSVQNPIFSKLSNVDKERFSELLKKHYPGLLIKEIYQIGAFEINSNNWKIVSDEAVFILKRADVHKLAPLSAQAQWTARLEESLFPTLRFFKNKGGQLISNDKNFIYCLTYFEEGLYFGSSLQEWPELIANQRRLYDYSLKDNSFDSLTFPSRNFFTIEEDQLIGKLKSYPDLKDVSKLHLSVVIEEYEKLQHVFHAAKNKLNSKVFHVDIHPHNLIFNQHKLILFTDFESFQLTTVEVSLGFGLYKCIRQLLTIEENLTDQRCIEILSLLKMQFHSGFPEHNFIELFVLGKIDVLKRILYILKELTETGQSKWLFILQTQLIALEEINEIVRILSLTDQRNYDKL